MMRVSLVGTVHAATGRVSAEELQAILARSQPDVIFAEISAAEVDHYKDGSHGTLESITVARHVASHRVDVEPVDLRENALSMRGATHFHFPTRDRKGGFLCVPSGASFFSHTSLPSDGRKGTSQKVRAQERAERRQLVQT
jgi:hypothetical protein